MLFITGNGFAVPPIQPVTAPADHSITPSPPDVALASRMPSEATKTLTTEKTLNNDKSNPQIVEASPGEFPFSTVIIPVVVGLVVIILLVLGISLVWIRMKRRRVSRTERSSSIDEDKNTKTEAVKPISKTRSSSVDDDSHDISLQHWTSKKAVSNRYESWHIGEIDQEWVCLLLVKSIHVVRPNLLFALIRETKTRRKMVGNFHVIACTSSAFWAKAVLVKFGNARLSISLVKLYPCILLLKKKITLKFFFPHIIRSGIRCIVLT